MREIKFRGKRINRHGEWGYGDFRTDGKHHWIFPQDKDAAYDRDMVDPNTIGQFIGLKDKNLKDIYEGDIIIAHADLGYDITGVVIFTQGSFFIKPCDKIFDLRNFVGVEEFQDGPALIKVRYTYEVIGNKYDNPELINDNNKL